VQELGVALLWSGRIAEQHRNREAAGPKRRRGSSIASTCSTE
jgi:hypothetical protein